MFINSLTDTDTPPYIHTRMHTYKCLCSWHTHSFANSHTLPRYCTASFGSRARAGQMAGRIHSCSLPPPLTPWQLLWALKADLGEEPLTAESPADTSGPSVVHINYPKRLRFCGWALESDPPSSPRSGLELLASGVKLTRYLPFSALTFFPCETVIIVTACYF